MLKPNKIVIKEEQSLMTDLVEEFITIGQRAIEKRGRFSIALSGGKTPIGFYQKLAEFKDQDFWQKTFVFLTDERYVPYDHPHNNFRMIQKNLLDQIPVPKSQLFPMKTDVHPLEKSVEDYTSVLRSFFQQSEFPQMDFLLMGIGPDGHTASLFPQSPQLKERERWVVASESSQVEHQRISLTFPVINHGQNVYFLVIGRDKSQILQEMLQDRKSYPAALVQPLSGQLVYFLDPAAASLLSAAKKPF